MRAACVIGLGAAAAAVMVLAAGSPAPAPSSAAPAPAWGSSVGPPLARDELFPQRLALRPDPRPFPGRRILTGGPADDGDWMYLDVWYIIGPFPLPARGGAAAPPNSLAFPPEAAVDLDAAYPGKEGMDLAWQWRMSNTLCVVPHVAANYAVWYAWTEVYSDADRDAWFAFGWDDFGKVWIGGALAADGGPTPHPWIPDRAVLKVRLKKGFTPVLVRLENAGGTTGFSAMVHRGPAGD
jgi:hypothetical protein